MLFPQKKERESRFKLALRTVIPTLLFLFTLFGFFLNEEEFLLFFTLMIAASIIISYYNLYVIYSGFDENVIDPETMVLNYKTFKSISHKQRKKALHYSYLMLKIGDLESINAHYGRERTHVTLKNAIAQVSQRIDELGFKNIPVGYYGSGYFIFGMDYAQEDIEDIVIPFIKSKATCYVEDIEVDIDCAAIEAKDNTQHAEELFRRLFDTINGTFDIKKLEDGSSDYYTIQRRVKEAIKAQSLSLQYQEVLNSKTGESEIIEFSAKLIDCKDRFIHHNDIMPVINQLGLEKSFYLLVVEKVMSLVAKKGIDKTIALTISAFALRHIEVREGIFRLLKNYHIKPGQLILIVQEERLYRHIKRYNEVIQSYRDAGIAIAFSKMGSVSPVLEYLKYIQVDYVKYDRSISDHCDDPYVQSVYDGLDTIMTQRFIKRWAVMVENGHIQERLTSRGIEYLQGWHLGKFEPVETIEKII